MSKQTDIVTFSRSITPYTQFDVFNELKEKYLNNGWVLFSASPLGIVGPELMMAYTLVKYEDEATLAAFGQSDGFTAGNSAPKKRGRPAKVVETEAE